MTAIFMGCFALTLLLGLWQARRTSSQSDFVLGGSKLPGWLLAVGPACYAGEEVTSQRDLVAGISQ